MRFFGFFRLLRPVELVLNLLESVLEERAHFVCCFLRLIRNARFFLQLRLILALTLSLLLLLLLSRFLLSLLIWHWLGSSILRVVRFLLTRLLGLLAALGPLLIHVILHRNVLLQHLFILFLLMFVLFLHLLRQYGIYQFPASFLFLLFRKLFLFVFVWIVHYYFIHIARLLLFQLLKS